MVTVNRRTRRRSGAPLRPRFAANGARRDAARSQCVGDEFAFDDEWLPEIVELTPEEGRTFFDREVRRTIGMSGEEFLRRYDRGDYAGIEEDEFGRKLIRLEFLIPFARNRSGS